MIATRVLCQLKARREAGDAVALQATGPVFSVGEDHWKVLMSIGHGQKRPPPFMSLLDNFLVGGALGSMPAVGTGQRYLVVMNDKGS